MSEEKKQSVRYLAMSERTIRLHRNLLVFSLVAILYVALDLKIGKMALSGIEVENFSGTVIQAALFFVILYHAIAYGCMAFEEFAQWRLTFRDVPWLMYSSGSREKSFREEISEAIKSIKENPMALRTKIEAGEPGKLDDIDRILKDYDSHFKQFTKLSLVRFLTIEFFIPYTLAVMSICALTKLVSMNWLRGILFSWFPL